MDCPHNKVSPIPFLGKRKKINQLKQNNKGKKTFISNNININKIDIYNAALPENTKHSETYKHDVPTNFKINN